MRLVRPASEDEMVAVLFLGFPAGIEWFRAALERDEVLEVLYVNWDWWLRLSGGSRRPRDAAR
jgi:hypothetical protein